MFLGNLSHLHALKGVGNRAFHRWVTRDSRPLFPRLPERTRLFRLFKTHQAWTRAFVAAPTVLGGLDTYGSEIIHPIREGRSPQQIGRKGLSNHRWIVGGKLCLLLHKAPCGRTLRMSALSSGASPLQGGDIRAAFDYLPFVIDHSVGRVPDAPHLHLTSTMRTAQRIPARTLLIRSMFGMRAKTGHSDFRPAK
jgi:hypothetical protein